MNRIRTNPAENVGHSEYVDRSSGKKPCLMHCHVLLEWSRMESAKEKRTRVWDRCWWDWVAITRVGPCKRRQVWQCYQQLEMIGANSYRRLKMVADDGGRLPEWRHSRNEARNRKDNTVFEKKFTKGQWVFLMAQFRVAFLSRLWIPCWDREREKSFVKFVSQLHSEGWII